MKKTLTILSAAVMFAACGTAKQATNQGNTDSLKQQKVVTADSVIVAPANKADKETALALGYIRKVNDNTVYTKNIVSKIDFTLDAMGKEVSVSGKLYLRKDEVIRIQLSPFGLMEVGRLEFTPDYVLLINRLEKEYVKATYKDVAFLRDNGLDFYSLQALFWNELFQPAKKILMDTDLSSFSTDMKQTPERHITYHAGKLLFDWTTDAAKAKITKAQLTYGKGTSQASTVTMEYGDFVPVGSKRFPSKEKVTFESKAFNTGRLTLQLLLNNITNDAKWESRSTVSDKYKQISADQFFRKIGNM